jgi:hypothetical protein
MLLVGNAWDVMVMLATVFARSVAAVGCSGPYGAAVPEFKGQALLSSEQHGRHSMIEAPLVLLPRSKDQACLFAVGAEQRQAVQGCTELQGISRTNWNSWLAVIAHPRRSCMAV